MPVEVVDSAGAGASALVAPAQATGDALLELLDLVEAEFCIVLVSDSHMRELNAQWRGKDAPTDVLSFSQVETDVCPPAGDADDDETLEPTVLLGDVIVSVDTLRRQASDGGWSDDEELARLVLHGLLHLLGHDHERDDEARVMRAEEGRLVSLLRQRGIGCAWEAGDA